MNYHLTAMYYSYGENRGCIPEEVSQALITYPCWNDFVAFLENVASEFQADEFCVIVDLNKYTRQQKVDLLKLVEIGRIN